MTPLTMQHPLYFIGWDYSSPQSIPLKRLLAHPESPWQTMAIVHDEIYVPSVDGIPLMRTQDFLILCRQTPNLKAVLKIKDPLHAKRWLRQAKALDITLLDEGEILQATSSHLRDRGTQMDLGVMVLPQALEAEHIQALQNTNEALPDELSHQTLRAYLQFMETGLLDSLRTVTQPEAGHPLCEPESWLASLPWTHATAPALAWEIAPHCTGFLDHAMLFSSAAPSQWTYAFSAETATAAEQEGRRLHALMAPFGIQPHIAQAAAPGLPVNNPRFVLAHIDQADPLQIMQRLAGLGCEVHVRLRLGRTPSQLVQLLRHFGYARPILRCDRPGPLGLYACLALRGNTA